MAVKLLVLLVALVGMVGSSSSGPTSKEEAYGVPKTGDADAGFRAFGKVVSAVTVVAAIVIVLILVAMLFSIGGVWQKDVIDPPV